MKAGTRKKKTPRQRCFRVRLAKTKGLNNYIMNKLDLEECAYYLRGLECITEAVFRDFGVTGYPMDPYRDAIGFCLSNSIRMIRERMEEIDNEKNS